MTDALIEISSKGGRIGRIAWDNKGPHSNGYIWWSCWPWSFAIERTIVNAKPRKLKAEYTLEVETFECIFPKSDELEDQK